VTNNNFCFYLQNRLIQTSQTGDQWYSDTSPFSIPWLYTKWPNLLQQFPEASYLVLGVQDGEGPLGSHGPGVGLVVLEPENAGEVSAEAAVKLLGLAQDGIVLAIGVF
jgi:hypothetical protein